MGLFEDLNELGLLAIGATPQWVDVALADALFAPNSASDGVYLQNSPLAQLYVAPREDVSKRTSRVVVTVGDVATTYTITIGGNAVATTPASAVLADIVLEMIVDITASAPALALVTPTVDPDDATGATLLLQGKAEADYSIDATAAAGTGALTSSADGSTADLRLYFTPAGEIKSGSTGNANRWVQAFDAYYASGVDYRGFVERIKTAGLERMYVEVESLTGDAADGGTVVLTCRIMIGPAVLES